MRIVRAPAQPLLRGCRGNRFTPWLRRAQLAQFIPIPRCESESSRCGDVFAYCESLDERQRSSGQNGARSPSRFWSGAKNAEAHDPTHRLKVRGRVHPNDGVRSGRQGGGGDPADARLCSGPCGCHTATVVRTMLSSQRKTGKHMTKDSDQALLLAFFLWMLAFGLASVAVAQGHVVEHVASATGRVALTGADGATFAAAGVRLILNCEAEPLPRVEISDEQGAFRFERVPVDGCTISTDLQGFRSATAAIKAPHVTDLQFHLEVEPVFASVTVIGGASGDARIGCHVSSGAARVRRPVRSPQEGAEDSAACRHGRRRGLHDSQQSVCASEGAGPKTCHSSRSEW